MKKSELTQLIAQYKPEKLLSFLSIVSLVRDESKEIKALKTILASVSALVDDAPLPAQAVDELKRVLATASSQDEPTTHILQQLHVHLHPLDPFKNIKTPWKWIDLQARLAGSIDLPAFFRDCLSPVLDIVTASRLARTCKAGKFVTLNPDSEIYQKSAARLLKLVMKGEQDAAEAMIKSNPRILGAVSEATDYADRTILTMPLKYAVWAGDWYMYKMLLKHMSPKTVQEQIKDLNQNGLGEDGEHGPRFDFTDLFAAYKAFIKRAEVIWAQLNQSNADYNELERLWESVYLEQAKLPAHVIHQFMHPNRSFLIDGKPPEFNEPKLPRNSKFDDGKSVFAESREYVFGSNCGVVRYKWPTAYGVPGRRAWWAPAAVAEHHDFAALRRLVEVITNNYEQTFKEALSYSIESRATSSTSGLR